MQDFAQDGWALTWPANEDVLAFRVKFWFWFCPVAFHFAHDVVGK